jgi:glutamate--cysteine ligase
VTHGRGARQSRRDLERLDREDAPLLEPLAEVAASGRSPGQRVLEVWEKDPRPEALLGHFTL